MGMKIEEMIGFLEQMGIKKYKQRGEEVIFGTVTETYCCPTGEKHVLLVVQLQENGEYFKLFAPQAFKVKGEHEDAFFKTCMMVQWQTKLIQFEYDESDGEVRPIIEFPLEDGSITYKQLARCVAGMVQLLDEYYPRLAEAQATGECLSGTDLTLRRLQEQIARLQAQKAEAEGKKGADAPSEL